MANNNISEEDLNVILSDYRKRKFSGNVIKLAEADLKSGLAEEQIFQVLGRNATPHGMQQLFSQIKADMANTEKAKEPEPLKIGEQPEEVAREQKASGQAEMQYKPEDIVRAMEPMFLKLTEGLTEALKPNLKLMNQVVGSMNAMQTQMESEKERAEENRLNAELDRLEKQVQELQKDLANSAGVIKSKESEIGRLREEMVKMKEEPKKEERTKEQTTGQPVPATGPLKEPEVTGLEVSQKPTVNEPAVGKPEVRKPETMESRTVHIVSAGGKHTEESGTEMSRQQEMKKTAFTGNCQTVIRTPDGKEISVQIERMEQRRPKGVAAMAAKLFTGSHSQKVLLHMLIDKRLKPDQLKEIKRAKDNHFTEDELTDLIESDLPAEEMAGIIDVILSDRR